MIKKEFNGTFAPIYYNECEAIGPLGFQIENRRCTLCDILKEMLDVDPGMFDIDHKLIGKKIKLTMEIED